MTAKEFNKKYKDYIEEGFSGLEIDRPEIVKYLDMIFIDLIKIDGFEFSQIKMDCGYARFSSNLKSPIGFLIERSINEKHKKILNNEATTNKKRRS